jgi:RNA polymerase sigma factor (sigma-70 family)
MEAVIERPVDTLPAPPLAPAAGVQQLQATFVARMEAVRPAVEQIVSRGRLADPEAAVQAVWLKAWAAYPRMVAIEERALARELPSPHRWRAWFARIAKRVVIDEKRRDEVVRRLYGVRVVPGGAGNGSGSSAAPITGASGRGGGTEPAGGLDSVPDVNSLSAASLAIAAEQRTMLARALAGLNRRQREVLRYFAAGVPDQEVAARMRLAPADVRRLQARALMRLRSAYRQNEYRTRA